MAAIAVTFLSQLTLGNHFGDMQRKREVQDGFNKFFLSLEFAALLSLSLFYFFFSFSSDPNQTSSPFSSDRIDHLSRAQTRRLRDDPPGICSS